MNSKKIKLLAMLLILLLLSLIALLPMLLGNEGNGNEGETEKSEQSGYITLVNKEADQIVGIDYIYDGGDTISLIKPASKWITPKDEYLPINQSTIDNLTLALCSVMAQSKVVDTASDYDQYGLKSPASQITLTYKDESEMTFYLGAENPRLDGTLYLKTANDPAVYLVSENMLTYFAYSLDDLLVLDKMPELATSHIVSIQITNPRASGILLSAKTEGASTVVTATYQNGDTQVLSSPNLLGDLLAGVTGLVLNDAVSCAPITDEILMRYGLDEGNATNLIVTYSAEDKEKVLAVAYGFECEKQGEDEEDRYFYVLVKESGYIYRCLLPTPDILGDFAPAQSES